MTAFLPPLPALVVGHVAHRRRGPLEHAFRHAAYQWLVDLDSLPAPPRLLRAFAFDSADHLGDPTASIRSNVDHFLSLHGVELGDRGRVVMLANARVLGHVFDPLSVFWCYDGQGRLACVVAEVHNTFGQRHAYLLRPDATGRAAVPKDFPVSPFFDVTGDYELRFTVSPTTVSVAVALRRDGAVTFSASFTGRPRPVTARSLTWLLLRRPLMPQRVSALIRLHGVRLWMRGLPVVTRPASTGKAAA